MVTLAEAEAKALFLEAGPSRPGAARRWASPLSRWEGARRANAALLCPWGMWGSPGGQ